jgi:hypothetical protein
MARNEGDWPFTADREGLLVHRDLRHGEKLRG